MKNLLFLILISSINCSAQFITTEIQSNFNSREIKDLEKIVFFFKNQISSKENEDFANSIINLSPEIERNYYEAIYNRIDFKEQLNLYQSISKDTFNSIWKTTEVKNYHNLSSLSICFSGKGKSYSNFLVQIGMKNKYISAYSQDLIISGDFTATNNFIDYFLNSLSAEELNNPNYQLIIAIHFLTINDQQKRAIK